jgi:hypothetical protein
MYVDKRSLTRRGMLAAAATSVLGVAYWRQLPGPVKDAPIRRAPRPGSLPAAGTPTVAGVELPEGLPVGHWFWRTAGPTERAFEVADALAAAFPRTGLWPCLWTLDDPAEYFDHWQRDASLGHRTADDVLRKLWGHPAPTWVAPFTSFPGLADPTSSIAEPFRPFSAYRDLLAARADAGRGVPGDLAPTLLLVPCTRPSDAFLTLDPPLGEEQGVAAVEATIVLRSWQSRFDATLIALGGHWIALATGAPPQTLDHAVRVAAEQYAFAPPDDGGTPGALARMAPPLVQGSATADTSPLIWELGWTG